MKRLLTPTALLASTLACCAGAIAQQPLVGLNLESISYYTPETTFVDLTNRMPTFTAQRDGAGWGVSDPGAMTLGSNGYPTQLAANHTAFALISIPYGYPRDENHVLLWEGTGDVELMFDDGSLTVTSAANRREVRLPTIPLGQQPIEGNDSGVRITASDPSDPVRNIRFVPLSEEVSYTNSTPDNPFRQQFLDRWRWSGSFRYKDWGIVDDEESTITDWSSRPTLGSATQGSLEKGVAIENMIKHANATQTHPWISIPHAATDDYIRNAAELIRDTLDDGLAVRVEYSNEVWNLEYPQHSHARQMAASIGEQQDFTGAMRYYAHRSGEIFDIFEEVFTASGTNPDGMDRLVRVLGSQADWEYVAHEVLGYKDVAQRADALAIAPYFGGSIAADPDEFNFDAGSRNTEQWLNASWNERLEWVESDLQKALGLMDSHMNLLQNTTDGGGDNVYDHLSLFAYEGGQHYLGHYDTHNDQAFQSLMYELSHRPEMEDYYRRYLEHWFEIGGEDFILYNAMTSSSVYGYWGLLEHEGQSLDSAPKLRGVRNFLASVPEPRAVSLAIPVMLGLLIRSRE